MPDKLVDALHTNTDSAIAHWYRYDIMLYVQDDIAASLPQPVLTCRVPDTKQLDDHWPLPYRLRDALFRRLPTGVANRASRIKATLAARRAGVKVSF